MPSDAQLRAEAPAAAAVVLALAGIRRGATVLVTGSGVALCARAAAAAATASGRVLHCTPGLEADDRVAGSQPGAAPVLQLVAATSRLPAAGAAFDTVIALGTGPIGSAEAAELHRVARAGARIVLATPPGLVADALELLARSGFELRHITEVASAGPGGSHLVATRSA